MAKSGPKGEAGHRRRLEGILQIVRRLASERELDPMLFAIVQETCALLNAERATIFMYDAKHDELYSRTVTEVEIEEIRIPADYNSIAGCVAKDNCCLNIPDAYADPRFNRGVDKMTGWRTRNIVAVPMTNLDGELVGVLEAMNKRGGAFTADDCGLMTALAAQAGVALERARLLEEFLEKQRLENEMNLARDIQMGLLPKVPPEVAGLELAGWSLPSEYAGGDFFDLFAWGEGRVGLMLGDAVGHGVGPALLAAETRALVRALALHESDPASVLTDANRMLAADVDVGRFVTLALAVVEGRSGKVWYASAGHGPQLALRADGACERLGSTGLPLGIMAEVPVEGAAPLELGPGDALLMTSDGIFECDTADGGELGIEAVIETAQRHLSGPAEALLGALKRLTEESNPTGYFRDDRTAVIARRIA